MEPPPGALNVQRTVVAQSWVRLESLLVAEYDEAAAEGRRAGVFETARAFSRTRRRSDDRVCAALIPN